MSSGSYVFFVRFIRAAEMVQERFFESLMLSCGQMVGMCLGAHD